VASLAFAVVAGTLVAFALVGAWAARGRVDSAESFVAARLADRRTDLRALDAAVVRDGD